MTDAMNRLDDLQRRLRNAGSASPDPAIRADQLVRWAESAERELRTLFSDDRLWTGIYSERFWRIRDLVTESIRPGALIDDEIDSQVHRLQALHHSLGNLTASLTVPKNCKLVVLDTNILIHYQLFTDIPWESVAGGKQARLVFPLVVIDELDRLKEGPGLVAKRAKVAIKHLRRLSMEGGAQTTLFAVRKNVTWQYLEEPASYIRRPSNDDEIVRQCSVINAVAGQVLLVTKDFGMEIRARVAGVPNQLMPAEYRYKADETEFPGETT